jgi:hypothetical protein
MICIERRPRHDYNEDGSLVRITTFGALLGYSRKEQERCLAPVQPADRATVA